ncbi:hypothetical protein GQR58_010090 [Nymphon striatum]|nr:hypothetical protein GQR58_010090 [Nymphon striatum]
MSEDQTEKNLQSSSLGYSSHLDGSFNYYCRALGLHVYIDRTLPISQYVEVALDTSLILIAAASFLFFATTLGCVGALRDNLFILKIEERQFNYLCGYNVLTEKGNKIGDVIYTKGCMVVLDEILRKNALLVGATSFGITIPMFFLICLVLILSASIRKDREHFETTASSSPAHSKINTSVLIQY